MFDLGWSELLIIGIVALIVVGPKDLPVLFRRAGQMMGRVRAMAGEFSRAMNDAADQSGMREMADTMRAASDPKSFGTEAMRDAFDLSPRKDVPSPEELAEEPDAPAQAPKEAEKKAQE